MESRDDETACHGHQDAGWLTATSSSAGDPLEVTVHEVGNRLRTPTTSSCSATRPAVRAAGVFVFDRLFLVAGRLLLNSCLGGSAMCVVKSPTWTPSTGVRSKVSWPCGPDLRPEPD